MHCITMWCYTVLFFLEPRCTHNKTTIRELGKQHRRCVRDEKVGVVIDDWGRGMRAEVVPI